MIYVHERGFGPLDKDIKCSKNSADWEHCCMWIPTRRNGQRAGKTFSLLGRDVQIFNYSPGAQKSSRKIVQYPEACSMALENSSCHHDALSSGIATMSLPEICKQYDLKPTRSTDALGSVVRFLMRKVYQQIPSRLRQLPSEYMLRRVRPEKET